MEHFRDRSEQGLKDFAERQQDKQRKSFDDYLKKDWAAEAVIKMPEADIANLRKTVASSVPEGLEEFDAKTDGLKVQFQEDIANAVKESKDPAVLRSAIIMAYDKFKKGIEDAQWDAFKGIGDKQERDRRLKELADAQKQRNAIDDFFKSFEKMRDEEMFRKMEQDEKKRREKWEKLTQIDPEGAGFSDNESKIATAENTLDFTKA